MTTTQGKRSFMTAIEKSHGRQLRRFLSARLRGASADIPDLVQEIFIRLLRIKDHEAVFPMHSRRVGQASSYSNGQTPYSRNSNQFGFNGAYYYLTAAWAF